MNPGALRRVEKTRKYLRLAYPTYFSDNEQILHHLHSFFLLTERNGLLPSQNSASSYNYSQLPALCYR